MPVPAGFEAMGVGMGALCMTCHNSYSGAHGDGLPPTEAAGASESAPHHGPQADIVMGKNAFFMADTGSNLSKHAMVLDTCVACHMKFYPQSFGTVAAPA